MVRVVFPASQIAFYRSTSGITVSILYVQSLKKFRLADIFEAINYAFLSVCLVSFVAGYVLSSGKFCLALSFTPEQIILIQKKKKKK